MKHASLPSGCFAQTSGDLQQRKTSGLSVYEGRSSPGADGGCSRLRAVVDVVSFSILLSPSHSFYLPLPSVRFPPRFRGESTPTRPNIRPMDYPFMLFMLSVIVAVLRVAIQQGIRPRTGRWLAIISATEMAVVLFFCGEACDNVFWSERKRCM